MLKSSLTFAAHIPTSISINSEPEAAKKGTSASQATALARSVFQLHGGQYNSTHLGILAHTFLYLVGFFK
ncbi:MAG: hypothetical protein ACOZBL_05320 [Patescibacteria group bacterium]